jgi:hypothetical protein
MLQIATGKLFKNPVARENRLRGILYTNAIFWQAEPIETAVGKLFPSSSHSISPTTLVYEFIEHMEQSAVERPLLLGSTVEPYLQDFSVVVSFALGCVCTPNVELAKRLTSGELGLVTRVSPRELVCRFFDKAYTCEKEDIATLIDFTNKLIGLQRTTFLGVMRALRTYINGMHRIADDIELAYTLLVASVESLAQDFDGGKSEWDTFDQRKRKAVDNALCGADAVVAQRVRDALLSVEYSSLGRRFREFAIDHITPAFFRQVQDRIGGGRLAQSELSGALNLAYRSRSKYVHQLLQLPDAVTMTSDYAETAIDGRFTHLTLHGLARLMRAVIIEFVMRQTSIDNEPHDYRFERVGIVQMPLAPQYWIGNPDGDISTVGREKLEGFLQQLDALVLKQPGAEITDMRPVLDKAVTFVTTIKKRLRQPYLALCVLFNRFVSPEELFPIPPAITKLIKTELALPSPESLIVHTLTDSMVTWPLEEHLQVWKQYLHSKSSNQGIRFPRTFEAAIALDLAERYRVLNDIDSCKEMIVSAVENHPGHAGLLKFEKQFNEIQTQISWRKVMMAL